MKNLNSVKRILLRKCKKTFKLVVLERGQSLVELSLILPVLFAMVLGVVEFGRIFYAAIEVSNAAATGAVYGSQNLFTASDTAGIEQAAKNDASDISSWTNNGVSVTAVKYCSCTDGTAITCSNAGSMCVSPARIEMYVKVDTEAPINMLFVSENGQPKTETVRGHAFMRVAQ